MAKILVYQLYPRTWTNIREMEQHLKRIAKLGVDYVWLSPMYPSPGFDHGYDVANYKAIDWRFGTMDDLKSFVGTAHSLGIGVLMDLVLNHTSTAHPWFREKPGYYYWSDSDRPGWENLFDRGSCWEKYRSNNPDEDEERGYYLHLFQKYQADLKWFNGDEINQTLLSEFRDIVKFWLDVHGVDGFRLDFPQGLNKDLDANTLEVFDLLWGNRMDDVISAIFDDPSVVTRDGKKPFLIAEFFDSTPAEVIRQCSIELPCIDFFLNPLVKSAILEKNGLHILDSCIEASVKNQKFMLDLESHDAPRFTSLSGLDPRQIFRLMFDSGASGICLYQGQELGVLNPTWIQLTDSAMVELDAMTAMRYHSGESLHDLRKYSRANARVRYSLTDYACQEGQSDSPLNYIKDIIRDWKSRA